MQNSPHDEGVRWFVTLLAIPLAGGVGWLVKHLMGRRGELVQLNLTGAQTDEIRARIRREDEVAAVAGLKELAGQLRGDRDHWRERAEAAEAEVERLLREAQARHKMINEVNAYRMRDLMIKKGMSYEEAQAQPVEPIYPEAEE